MEAIVYMLRCANGSYYSGLTRKDLASRLSEHVQGTFDGYTARHRPVELVFSCAFDRLTNAISCERQIKGWRRDKKEALIEGRLDLLPGLSRRKRSEE